MEDKNKKIGIMALIFALLALSQATVISSASTYSINGEQYFQTWDNRTVGTKLMNCPGNDCPYEASQDGTNLFLNYKNTTITLPYNNGYSYDWEIFKISPSLTFSKSLLSSKYVNINDTVAYLKFPYTLSITSYYIDDHNIRVGGWSWDNAITIYDNNKTQNYLNQSSYDLKIVNDEIRLYFVKSEANKLMGNITFRMNSWSINGSTIPAWNNTIKTHTTENNKRIVVGNLRETVDDGDLSASPEWVLNGAVVENNKIALNGGSKSINISFQKSAGTVWGFDIYNSSDMSGGNAYSPGYKYSIINSSNFYSYKHWNTGSDGDLRYNAVISDANHYGTTKNTNLWDGTIKLIEIYRYSNGTSLLSINGTSFGSETENATNFLTGNYFEISGSSTPNKNVTIDNIWNRDIYQNAIVTSGNLTAYYDSLTGNEINQIDINATTPTDTNYTLWYANNSSGTWTQLGGTLTGNNSETISGTKYQNTDIQVRLQGNQTATPELIQITFHDQAVSGGAGEFIPSKPINCISSNGTSWINVSCSVGSGNITNFMNFTNTNLSTWNNNSNFYWNNTGLSEGTFYTYRIYAYNSSGNGSLNLTYATHSNTTLTTPILPSPSIISWENDNTSNQNLSLFISSGTNITFNFTSNQSLTSCSWGGSTKINCSGLNSYAYKNFTSIGVFYVTASGTNPNGTTQTITWTISSGGVISLDGYVFNELGVGIPNARLDIVGDGHQFTNSTGYYIFSNLSGLTHNTLVRAIGYTNLSEIHTNMIPVESHNFILSERSWATSDEANNAGSTGLIGGIIGGAMAVSAINARCRRRKKGD